MKRIIVLGMHRSGASSIARAVALLGASTGDPTHLSRSGDNTPLKKVNDTLLDGAGGAWEAPPLRPDWLEETAARSVVDRAERVLATEFADAPVAVWKDPRISLTLPFWLDLFDEDPILVLVHRHPDEVAASLRTSDSLRPAHSYALWEHYNAAALSAAAGLPTIVFDYGQVMSFPAEAATFLARALAVWGVELPNDPATTDLELSPQQRHHVARDREQIDPAYVTSSQSSLFTMLDSLAGPHRALAVTPKVPAPSPLSTEILTMAAALRHLQRERREARQGERKAKRTIKRSTLKATTTGAATPVDPAASRAVDPDDGSRDGPDPEATDSVSYSPETVAPVVAPVAAQSSE